MKNILLTAMSLSLLLASCANRSEVSAMPSTASGTDKSLSTQAITTDASGEVTFETTDEFINSAQLTEWDPTGEIKKQLQNVASIESRFGTFDNAYSYYNSLPESQKNEFESQNYSNSITDDSSGTITTDEGMREPGVDLNTALSDTTNDIKGCAKRFGYALRFRYHWIGQHRNYIDTVGRPQIGLALIPPFTAAGRDRTCQSKVGNLGNLEKGVSHSTHPKSVTYDGGHLVPSSIGGWGRRANLVPQNSLLNQAVLSTIDAQMSYCKRFVPRTVIFQTQALYNDSTTNVPDRFILTIAFPRNSKGFTARHLPFQNESPDLIKPSNQYVPYQHTVRGEVAKIVEWLKSKGCVAPTPIRYQ